MSMQIVNDTIAFNSFEGSGPRSDTKIISLAANASQVTALLTGFNAAFSPSDGDHHLGNLDIRLSVRFVPSAPSATVEVKAIFGLRDWSNEWDDKYEGVVRFAVVAE
jgi:hypothetical protein